jgi:hypothetical protein
MGLAGTASALSCSGRTLFRGSYLAPLERDRGRGRDLATHGPAGSRDGGVSVLYIEGVPAGQHGTGWSACITNICIRARIGVCSSTSNTIIANPSSVWPDGSCHRRPGVTSRFPFQPIHAARKGVLRTGCHACALDTLADRCTVGTVCSEHPSANGKARAASLRTPLRKQRHDCILLRHVSPFCLHLCPLHKYSPLHACIQAPFVPAAVMAFQIGRWSYCTYTADDRPEWHVDGDPRREHDGGTTSPTLTLLSAARASKRRREYGGPPRCPLVKISPAHRSAVAYTSPKTSTALPC